MNQLRLDDEAIFHVARGIEAPEVRAAYLAQVCGADRDLRDEVDALLSAYDRDRSFLESPPVDPEGITDEAWQLPTEAPGVMIGPYRLMEQIGEGGMGVVYVAEQHEPVRRKVALKVIKPGMDTMQVVARFEAERQALAMMDHPNIARIFDGGVTESGRPYFVMELVRGLPITEYCDGERLSVRERLELFVLVCRAVQHAHQKGIIHRDLKPSNIMVTLHDGVPVPKVIDFGVAKAIGGGLTEETVYTAFTQLVGTPLYMSPEQVELSGLDIDTRSDIYSLGVLLYELLTGTTPFDSESLGKAAFDEMRRIIREEEPPKPSTRLSSLGATRTTVSANRGADSRHLDRAVRDELDWIVMKALEKDRRRRYETANDFAADVMRHLSDRPVEAAPPSAWYRLGKFLRRNRAVVFPTAIMTLLTVAGLSAGIVMVTREQGETRMQRRRAEANFRKARDAVDRMFTRVARDLVDVPHMEQVRRALLEDALEFYQGFLKERSTDPGVTHEAARAYMQVGTLYHELGRFDQVEKPLGQAITLLNGLSEKLPAVPEIRVDLARCYSELALLHLWAQRSRQAIEGRRKALAVREKLAADFPTVPAYARDLARAHSALATTLITAGEAHFKEAEEHHRKALAIWQEHEEDFPKLPKDRAGEAHLRHWWGSLLEKTGRFPEAETEYRKVLALREQLVAEAPTPKNRADLEHINQYIGELLILTGRPDQAESFLSQGIEIRERLRDDFPHIPDHRRRLGESYYSLYRALLAMGRIQEAEEAIRRCVAIVKTLVDEYPGVLPHPAMLAYRYDMLGRLLYRTGRIEEAADAFRQALEGFEKVLVESPDGTSVLILLSELLTFCPAPQFRDEVRAVALLKRALQRAPTVGLCWLDLGAALYRTGAWEGAVEALTKSVELRNLTPAEAAMSQLFLAMAHWRRGEKDRARTWYDKAVAWMEKNQPKNEELLRFRAEAAALLGVTEPRQPDDRATPTAKED